MVEDKPIDEAAKKFLENDFNQCFTQMRHYDLQILDITKFSFTAYSILIGSAFALYKYSTSEGIKAQIDLTPVALSLLGAGFVMGLFMLALVVRNRAYYVYVARYINEHRRFFLSTKPLGFMNETRMYMSLTQPPFFNWRSSQAFHIYLLSAMNSILLCVLALILVVQCCPTFTSWIPLSAMCMSFLIQLGVSVRYLKSREKKSADAGVFGREAESQIRHK